MLKLGHASISEKGTINGLAGDQTGGEVTTRSYYDKKWLYIYRPTSINLAESLVKSMYNACENNNIGYGQSDRLTLYYECLRLVKGGRILPSTIKDVTKKVNCDCSSLVALCCIACGLRVNPSMTTWNQYGELKATGCFEIINFATIKSPDYLDYGDILQAEQHTAIVLESNREYSAPAKTDKVTARYPAYGYDTKLAGMYTVRVSDFLALRDGADTKKDILYKLQNGDIVYCYGYYTKDWLYIQFVANGIVYTGFAHKDYLYKM